MSSEVNPVMRTVSFVERIDFEFRGNVIPQTMVLADVDNDQANELIVGNIHGDIAIFKGDSHSQPWKKLSLSGMLTCLAVGEFALPKKNSLVCMTAEGWCYVYDVSSLSASQSAVFNDESLEKPILTQELPANARVMCLADINMDGHVEMIIGYSDRVVRAFRWHEGQDSSIGHFTLFYKWQLAGQIGSITINYNGEGQPELMVSQPGGTFVSLKVRPFFRHVRSDGQINLRALGLRHGLPGLERRSSYAGGTQHNSSSKLNLSAQSIDLAGIRDSPAPTNNSDTFSTHSDMSNPSLENVNHKLISGNGRSSRPRLQKSASDADQPGSNSRKGSGQTECSSEDDLENSVIKYPAQIGSVEKLDRSVKTGNNRDGVDSDATNGVKKSRGRHSNELDGCFDSEDTSIVYHPLASHGPHNEDSTTFMIGSISNTVWRGDESNAGEPTYYALATLDGSFAMLDHEDNLIWSLQVDHELFALSKLDITGDGKEEAICCSWNGQTYIVNDKKKIVHYHFPDSVAAFCAGYYSVHERRNIPCLVYATTNNCISIFYNVVLPYLQSTNLVESMSSKSGAAELLHKLNIKSEDHVSLQQLYGWCLYGKHNKS